MPKWHSITPEDQCLYYRHCYTSNAVRKLLNKEKKSLQLEVRGRRVINCNKRGSRHGPPGHGQLEVGQKEEEGKEK